MKPTNSVYVGGPPLDPPDEDEEENRCPYCGAYHINEFAHAFHLEKCQARESFNDAENNDYPE